MNINEDEIVELATKIFVQRCGNPGFAQYPEDARQCFELAEMFLRIVLDRKNFNNYCVVDEEDF